MEKEPINQMTEQARRLARALLHDMRHASLGTVDPETGMPLVTRIAAQSDPDGAPVALLSGLAAHSKALLADQRVGLLVSAIAPKGDVMTHARLSIMGHAIPAEPDPLRRDRWLARDPKARVYIDLPDFRFWRITPVTGLLNAGFGQAFRLTAADMLISPAA